MTVSTMSPPTNVLHQSVVVFSNNYLPMSRINIKRAVMLLLTDRAEPLEIDTSPGWELRSSSRVMLVPAYIRLKVSTAERLWRVPPVSRRELLRRDHHTCQYCSSTKALTIDHVIPRSKGGSHSWDNVVIACERCNSKKGDKLLHETNMKLRHQPKAPLHPVVAFAEEFWHQHYQEK